MGFFTKKPVQIEAIQLTEQNVDSVIAFCQGKIKSHPLTGVVIETLEGDMLASKGDWIIKGIKGEFYPCKPDIFEQSYNPSYKESEMDLSVKNTYVNSLIKSLLNGETNGISDGYHTFGELYEHRITLFIALCKADGFIGISPVWKSKFHSDGSSFDGWFVLGTGKEKGKQITYHLPMSKWDLCDFAETLEKAPEWDGHTSEDVLKRLQNL